MPETPAFPSDAYFNAKYSAFYVMRYSRKAGKPVAIGKPYATIEAATRAAERADKRTGGTIFHTVDTVRS